MCKTVPKGAKYIVAPLFETILDSRGAPMDWQLADPTLQVVSFKQKEMAALNAHSSEQ